MAAKNSPDGFCKAATFSSNIHGRLFSTILIRGNFLNYLYFKLAVDFKLFFSIRSINNIAIKKERMKH